MGLTRAATRGCAIALACVPVVAQANTVTLDNGVTGTGHLDVTMDDFGSYGRWVGPNSADNYQPPNYSKPDPLTNVSTVYLFPSVGGHKGAVELTGYKILHNLVTGGGNGNGISGDYAALTRTVTTGITMTGGVASSAFTIADTASGLKLDFLLSAKLVVETAPASRLEETFTINNSGPDGVIINFHALWDMNVIYAPMASADDDIVGVPPGLCYVYMRDPGSTVWGGSFADGGSALGAPGALAPMPPLGYYGAKEFELPEGQQPPFSVATSTQQPVWTGYKMPQTWINELAEVGKNKAGETTMTASAAVGYEYQFLINAGGQAKITLYRHYGTTTMPCPSNNPNCGNGMLDAGETCDSATDTPQCDAMLCTAPSCGDNHVNAAAGETCESNGIDTADCNGAVGGPCTAPACGDGYLNTAAGEMCDDGANTATCNLTNCLPPACGDGIVNEAAGEECDGGELCATDCKWAFSLGGGCAGCSSSGDGEGALLLAGVVAFSVRRHRRARRG